MRRSEISEREIGLVFALDSERNLQTLSGKLSGIYSYLPVEGEQTGLLFGIFGDFISQPGRDLINYGAKWNHWLCEEVTEFFKQVLREVFSPHPSWRFFPAELLSRVQYITISGPGKEFWDSKLRNPIKDFHEAEALYPDEEGILRKLDELIRAVSEVVQVVEKDTLKEVTGKRIAHPSIMQNIQSKVEVIGIRDLRCRRELLEPFKGHPEKLINLQIETIYDLLYTREMIKLLKDQPERLAEVYRHIVDLTPYYIGGRRGGDPMPLYAVPFVLADDGEFYPPNQMVMIETDPAHLPEFLKTALPVLSEKNRLHPKIAKDQAAVRGLKKWAAYTILGAAIG